MSITSHIGDYPVQIKTKVGWGDMDAYGHLNNTRYFRYFEDLRLEYLLRLGVDFEKEFSEFGVIVGSTSCKFKYPLKFPDEIIIAGKVTNLDDSRFVMNYKVIHVASERVAATGDALLISFNLKTEEPEDIPDLVRTRIKELEKNKGDG